MRRISKVEVLHAAIDYIRALDNVLCISDNMDKTLRLQQQQQASIPFVYGNSATASGFDSSGGMGSSHVVGYQQYSGYDTRLSGGLNVAVGHAAKRDQFTYDEYEEMSGANVGQQLHVHRQQQNETEQVLYTRSAAQSAAFSLPNYSAAVKETASPDADAVAPPVHVRRGGNAPNAKDVLSSRLHQKMCRQRTHSSAANYGIDLGGAEESKEQQRNGSLCQLVWPGFQPFGSDSERYTNYSSAY